ncbi:hypothetical protein AJ79_08747 [Helicocarpus griseus UAMH5409]|uniref:Tim44-like domain-containing protein n=1 Tax=Helicocarpus griseus UAMH5409 TaxID=1447875 RepID=A0A2B7WQV8_9EURO|nr:hypothetical protein AJ79_08747 [Helicocarpus griseus UAMH5409]
MASSLAPRSSPYLVSSLSSRTTPLPLHIRPSLRIFPSPLSFQCSQLHSRPFSHTPQRGSGMKGAQMMKQKAPPALSRENQLKEALAKMKPEDFPDDMGLLPGTFVRPSWEEMPSIFKYPRQRLRMEWQSIKSKLQDIVLLLAYYKYSNRSLKLPLRLRERKRAALDLHKTFYTALAAADTSTIRDICCNGLRDDFLRRISARPADAKKHTWTLHKYTKFPFALNLTGARVVADRAAQAPHNMGFRQVIVRIRSRQSLVRPVSQVKESSEQQKKKQVETPPKDFTEYVVLQKMLVAGVELPWKIWGFTKATTMEELDTNPAFMAGLSLKERLELMTAAAKF